MGTRAADGNGPVNIKGDQSLRESKEKKRESIVAGPSTRNENSGDLFDADNHSPAHQLSCCQRYSSTPAIPVAGKKFWKVLDSHHCMSRRP
jgi:hypothetical protein